MQTVVHLQAAILKLQVLLFNGTEEPLDGFWNKWG